MTAVVRRLEERRELVERGRSDFAAGYGEGLRRAVRELGEEAPAAQAVRHVSAMLGLLAVALAAVAMAGAGPELLRSWQFWSLSAAWAFGASAWVAWEAGR